MTMAAPTPMTRDATSLTFEATGWGVDEHDAAFDAARVALGVAHPVARRLRLPDAPDGRPRVAVVYRCYHVAHPGPALPPRPLLG